MKEFNNKEQNIIQFFPENKDGAGRKSVPTWGSG